VGLGAVADVTLDGGLGGTVDGAGGVGEQSLLFVGVHQTDEITGLLEVVVVVLAVVEPVGVGTPPQCGLGVGGLFLPTAVGVRLEAGGPALVAVHTHGTVTVVGVEQLGTTRVVHRDLVVVDPHAVTGGVTVGEQAALQHTVRGDTDAGDQVGRGAGGLLHVGEVVLRVTVELELTDRDAGVVL